jgi:hypothetical protein
MTRPPFQRTLCNRAIRAVIFMMHRTALARADNARLDALMARVCRIRSARRCSALDLDLAAAKFAAARLAIAMQGATA